MAGKAKARYAVTIILSSELAASIDAFASFDRMILIRLVSTARTGFFYTAQKNRTYPTFSRMKYDPIG